MIPEYKITNNRHRGPKESAKMNLFAASLGWNIERLKDTLHELQVELDVVKELRASQDAGLVSRTRMHIERLERRFVK